MLCSDCQAMFAFEVDCEFETPQPGLRIQTANSNVLFVPEGRLPKFNKVDVKAKKGTLIFSQSDGCVELAWDEKKVSISLSSFGCDKGSITTEYVKDDDSFEQALKNWMFEKEKSAILAKEKKIEFDRDVALEEIKLNRKKLAIQENQIREKAETEKKLLFCRQNEQTAKKKKNKRRFNHKQKCLSNIYFLFVDISKNLEKKPGVILMV